MNCSDFIEWLGAISQIREAQWSKETWSSECILLQQLHKNCRECSIFELCKTDKFNTTKWILQINVAKTDTIDSF